MVIISIIESLKKEEKGQGMVEYGLILALVSVAVVGTIRGVGDKVSDTFSSVNQTLDGGIYTEEEIDKLVNEEGYIPIASADELDNLRNDVVQTFGQDTKWEGNYTSGLGNNYIQVANINLSGSGDFEPIGSVGVKFTGNFDGGGYTISNLSVNHGDYAGLFGFANEASFKNIVLKGMYVDGGLNTGGLVGKQYDSTIENSSTEGKVIGSLHYVGGMVGSQWGNSKIINSYALGSVTSSGNDVGGLSGRQEGSSTTNSYAIVNVRGKSNTGGLIGNQHTSTIDNSYSAGSVFGENSVGGLVGHHWSHSSVSDSYAIGRVTGSFSVGGLIGGQGDSSNDVLGNNYYDIETTLQSTSVGGTGLTSANMKDSSYYEGWDFDTVWQMNDGKYPTLR